MPDHSTTSATALASTSSEVLRKRQPLHIALPHRAVYEAVGMGARMRSMFRHAADEWYEFLQHDWRAVVLGLASITLSYVFTGIAQGWRKAMTELTGTVIGLSIPVSLAVGVFLWCLVKAPGELKKRKLWRELEDIRTLYTDALSAISRLRLDLGVADMAHAAAVAESDRLRGEVLRHHGPMIALEFVGRSRDTSAPIRVHNHGGGAAIDVSASITIRDAEHTMTLWLDQIGPRISQDIFPAALYVSDIEMGSKETGGQVLAFLVAARRAAHLARFEEDAVRMTRARESGDNGSRVDMRAALDGIHALTDTGAGSIEVAEFDVKYFDFAKKYEYRTPHVLTISANGDARISRTGMQPEPILIGSSDLDLTGGAV